MKIKRINKKKLKRVYITLLVITEICLGFLLPIGLNMIVNVKGQSDYDYTFTQNVPYSDYNNMSYEMINLRYTNTTTTIFNASYTFTNDRGLTEENISYIDQDNSGANSKPFIDNLTEGHSENIRANKANGETVNFYALFGDQDYGTWEAFMRITDATYTYQVGFGYNQPSGTFCFALMIQTDKWQYQDNGGWHDLGLTAIDNYWYHVKVDFETTAGGYLGLGQWKFGITIDNIDYGHSFSFATNQKPDGIRFYTSGGTSTQNIFLDAVGQTWDGNYTIGQNFAPLITDNNMTYIGNDKFEFAIDNDGNAYNSVDNPNIYGWDMLQAETYNGIYQDTPDNPWDYGVNIIGVSGTSGIENDTLDINGEAINITFDFSFLEFTENSGNVMIKIYSRKGTEIIRIRIIRSGVKEGEIQHYNGFTYDTDFYIYDIDNDTDHFGLNLYLNDFDCTILKYDNGILNGSDVFDFLEDELGVDEIEFGVTDSVSDSNYIRFLLDNVGLYQYNVSIYGEFGYWSYDLETSLWDNDIYNLFSFDWEYYCKVVSLDEAYYFDYTGILKPEKFTIRENINYSGIINLQEQDTLYIENPYLFLLINDAGCIPFVFSVEGVGLSDGVTTYYPDYDYDNVNVNDSYFYVRDSRLYGTLEITHDNLSEYINVEFNIPNFLGINRSVRLSNYRNGYGFGVLRVFYLGGTFTEYDFYFAPNIINSALPQEYIIDYVVIGAYDDNYNSYTNQTLLIWCEDLNFIYVPNVSFTILTTNMLYMIIPLLIILVPTFAVSLKFGKTAILPMLIFMVIITYAGGIYTGSELIPTWLFFIIIFSLGVLLYIQRKYGGDSDTRL